eukprot:2449117-Pyramimonas_sp.AAC.1
MCAGTFRTALGSDSSKLLSSAVKVKAHQSEDSVAAEDLVPFRINQQCDLSAKAALQLHPSFDPSSESSLR